MPWYISEQGQLIHAQTDVLAILVFETAKLMRLSSHDETVRELGHVTVFVAFFPRWVGLMMSLVTGAGRREG